MSSTTEGGMAEQVKVGLEDAASAVQEKGPGELSSRVAESSASLLTSARQPLADRYGRPPRQCGRRVRTCGSRGPVQLTGSARRLSSAAQRVERLGGYLERTSGERMLRDAEDFARRWPWAVAGMGLMVGFAASRFLKASSERRYEANPIGTVADPRTAPHKVTGMAMGRRATRTVARRHVRQREPHAWPGHRRRGDVMVASNGSENTGLREPIGEVARDLTRDLSLLVRQEVELARAEMAEKGRQQLPAWGCSAGRASSD